MFAEIMSWTYAALDPTPDPGALSADTDHPSGATSLYLHTVSATGADAGAVLAAVASGDLLRLVWGSTTIDYTAGGPAVRTGDVWAVPVSAAPAGPIIPGSMTQVAFLLATGPSITPSTPPASLADARSVWPDADTLDDDTLTELLAVSWARCVPYIPADVFTVADPADVTRWTHANILDARDLWTAARRDGDVIGFDTYAVRVRPLSDTVKGLLRPHVGRPMVG